MQRVARSRWPNCRGPEGTTEGLLRQDGRKDRKARRTGDPQGEQVWRKQRYGWNRQADGKAFRSRTTRLTGPNRRLNCRSRLSRSGRPQGTDRPTRSVGVTIGNGASRKAISMEDRARCDEHHDAAAPLVRKALAALDQSITAARRLIELARFGNEAKQTQ